MTTIERLGQFVSRDVRGKSLDAIQRKIALHVADAVAAWVAGAHAPEGRALLDFLTGSGKPGLMDAVMLHCALARLSEVDDIQLGSATTPGAVVVPAALTLGAALDSPAQAVSEAILAGYEAMIRLGAALNGPAILYRGIWPTYLSAPFGVAAAAARLLELDPLQAAHALALALTFSSPGVGHQGGPRMARWLALGQAARHGGAAATAAKAGFTADVGLLDRDFFASVYAINPLLERLTEGLGARFALEQVSFKPWCAARQTMAASHAMKEMVREGLVLEDVSGIGIAVPPAYLRMVNHGVSPAERSSFLTSAPYQLAIGVIDPPAQYRLDPSGSEPPDKVRALMAKVKVEADEKLLQHYPQCWPARVTVDVSGGKREKLVLHVPGDPQLPLGEAGIREKLARVLAPLLGKASAARVLDASFEALAANGNLGRLLIEIDGACRA